MIPEHYTKAERAAYAQARADASRDFQLSLTAGMRPTQDHAWIDGWRAGRPTPEAVLEAIKVELERQADDVHNGPYLAHSEDDADWTIDGHVDMEKLVQAIVGPAGLPPADRPYAALPAALQAASESRCDPCTAGEHGNCQGHTVSCWCPCSDEGAADGGRLG